MAGRLRVVQGPEAHGDADDFVAPAGQEAGRDSGIDAAAHGDDDAG